MVYLIWIINKRKISFKAMNNNAQKEINFSNNSYSLNFMKILKIAIKKWRLCGFE